MLALDKGDSVDLRLQQTDGGDVREITVTPDSGYQKQVGTPTIGVWMASTPTVAAVINDSVAAKAGLKPGDKVHGVTVDSVRTEIDVDGMGVDLQKVRASSPHKPITLHVTRVNKDTDVESQHDITLGVATGKRFGVELSMGPVVCIQKGSIAEQAGMQVGDVITRINGDAVGDPMTLPTRLLDFVGQSTEISIQRNSAEQVLSLTPAAPRMENSARRRNGPIGIDSLGIGYVIHPAVTGVLPDSPAAEAGIQVGDVLQSAQLVIPYQPIPEDERLPSLLGNWQEFRRKKQNGRMLEAFELDKPLAVDEENNNWPFVVSNMQGQQLFKVTLKYDRDGTEQTVTMDPGPSDTMLDSQRGFVLKGFEETRTAGNWTEALSLGTREVWEGMKQVLIVLRRIGANYKNLGGPLTIAAAATMEASEGLPRLLVFLTLLSANLAVLNFLPIPVLDGGHMFFLAYEGIVGKPVTSEFK